ncbi:MAG TPA: D-alanine--D-alanine ligase [Alphaproteobacteria bacterium]|jgi:D-alanine-D-alanine ligase|nr:D-alanine--D-alanine ligase [Alphaproteobacteria bacterium]
MTTKRRVAVLMGGWSAEREVSLVSGAAVARALSSLGHDVATIDVSRDMTALIARLTPRPDVAFNALHGRFGEDGCVQGVLEILEIPYTHSGVLASAMAMDKPTARRVFAQAGLRVAEGLVAHRDDILAGRVMAPPYVVKPVNEGSSVGVRIVRENDPPFHESSWPYGETVLVERYIPGREITVAVMGDRALGALEIRPKSGFYSYEAKYTEGKADHLMPAPLPQGRYEEVLEIGLTAHRVLGCRGVSRADLRFDDTKGGDGHFYVLEVNTQPGMTPLSLVPEIAGYRGITFEKLVNWIVEDASCPR